MNDPALTFAVTPPMPDFTDAADFSDAAAF
jgi:hypothetical protein